MSATSVLKSGFTTSAGEAARFNTLRSGNTTPLKKGSAVIDINDMGEMLKAGMRVNVPPTLRIKNFDLGYIVTLGLVLEKCSCN